VTTIEAVGNDYQRDYTLILDSSRQYARRCHIRSAVLRVPPCNCLVHVEGLRRRSRIRSSRNNDNGVVMIRILELVVLAAVLGFLAACAIDPAVKPWWTLSDESFIPIKPGISKADVQDLVGKSILEMSFPRLNEDVWDYRSLHGTTQIYITEVHFDRQGIVKYYTQHPDPAYTNRRR
jgi:hypothetical protein